MKKYIIPLTPITVLKTMSCNRPINKPTIPPTTFPLINAIKTTIIKPVFATTPNMLRLGSIVLSNMKFIMIIRKIIIDFNLNPPIILIGYNKHFMKFFEIYSWFYIDTFH